MIHDLNGNISYKLTPLLFVVLCHTRCIHVISSETKMINLKTLWYSKLHRQLEKLQYNSIKEKKSGRKDDLNDCCETAIQLRQQQKSHDITWLSKTNRTRLRARQSKTKLSPIAVQGTVTVFITGSFPFADSPLQWAVFALYSYSTFKSMLWWK